MRKIIGIVVLFIGLGVFFKHYVETRAFPQTYISQANISGQSKKAVEGTLIEALRKPIEIRIKNRVYKYRYSDLGIALDLNSTLHTTFEQNTKPFPQNVFSFFRGLRSNTLILPVLTFNTDYYHFTRDSVYDFSKNPDQIAVDNTAKRLVYQENEEKYTVDPQSLKTQIVMNFGKKTIIEPRLTKVQNKSVAKVLGMNTVLTNVFDSPVYITLRDYENSPRFTIPSDQLKLLINIKYDEEKNQLGIDFVGETIQTLMGNIHDYLKLDADKRIDQQKLKNDLVTLINARSHGQAMETIAASVGFTPNTSGNLARKYIEVDISQQTMYLFNEGNLANTYKISTGLYYPTPVGQFKILNKAVNAFSDIYNVWMPYWMAFYYGPEVDAYFGIHELPYWVSEDGQKIQRPREFIGSPHTGGCVALDIGAAREVYAFADVGMPVYVYN